MSASAAAPFGAWSGPRNPKILLVGEAWGESEAMLRLPFVGAAGQELWRMLGQAAEGKIDLYEHQRALRAMRYGPAWVRSRTQWLEQSSIALTNVFNFQPPGNSLEPLLVKKTECGEGYTLPPLTRGNFVPRALLPELSRLFSEIGMAKPNLVVALGNTACWALLRATNIGSIRGTVAAGVAQQEYSGRNPKVLPTYHPAGVLRQWNWRPIVVADFIKAFRECQFPEIIRPQRQVKINPTQAEIIQFVEFCEATKPPLAIDIETGNGQIKTVGFAPSKTQALVIPFVDKSSSASYWPSLATELEVWNLVKRLLATPGEKIFQNGVYDLQYLMRMGLRASGPIQDTMLFHHSIFPEMLKGLGFLGSVYTQEASWKLMRRAKPDTEKRDE